MTEKYIIYIACGSAAASAGLAKERLFKLLSDRGIHAEYRVLRISELSESVAAKKPHIIIVTAGQIPKSLPKDIIKLKGIPLITGFGLDEFADDLVSKLHE
jgi:galactitol-specific phosphotransferase system IIB component